MIILLRMLMVILMLGPISAPAAVAMPMEPVATAQQGSAEAMADEQHACCPAEAEGSAVQLTTERAVSHVSCDNSCSDCQHFCSASSAGLLTTNSYSPANADSVRSTILITAPHYSTSPLERPPHHS